MADLPPDLFEERADEILDEAIRAGKVPPARREEVLGLALAQGDGPSEAALDWLRTYVAELPVLVSPTPQQPGSPSFPPIPSDEALPPEFRRRLADAERRLAEERAKTLSRLTEIADHATAGDVGRTDPEARRARLLASRLEACAELLEADRVPPDEVDDLRRRINNAWSSFAGARHDTQVRESLLAAVEIGNAWLTRVREFGGAEKDAGRIAAARARSLFAVDCPDYATMLSDQDFLAAVTATILRRGRAPRGTVDRDKVLQGLSTKMGLQGDQVAVQAFKRHRKRRDK